MTEEQHEKRRTKRHGFWFGIFVGGILGALLGGVVVTGATVSAAPALAASAFGHRFGGRGLQDPEEARERAELAAELILARVDATEEQQAEVKRIISGVVEDLVPLAEQHRANRAALHDELAREAIDVDGIERLRQAEMALADSASRELAEALTAFAQTLSVDQRAELIEMGHRFHR